MVGDFGSASPVPDMRLGIFRGEGRKDALKIFISGELTSTQRRSSFTVAISLTLSMELHRTGVHDSEKSS